VEFKAVRSRSPGENDIQSLIREARPGKAMETLLPPGWRQEQTSWGLKTSVNEESGSTIIFNHREPDRKLT
jgi:hypothetical protein